MAHDLHFIRRASGAAWASVPREDRVIRELVTDTRSISTPEAALFIALPGTHRDGHRFVQQAYDKGVRAFLLSREMHPALPPDASVLQVPDTLSALQDIAASHRREFDIPVIGITGSNGKTVIKEWLYDALSEDGPAVRSPKSYNSQVGVPLSVWLLERRHRVAVFEAGISSPGEMNRLARVIQPTIGIFTNLGEAHSEGFRNDEQKVEEKLKLFETVKQLIFCYDHVLIREGVERLKAHRGAKGEGEMKTISWSIAKNTVADWHVSGLQIVGSETSFLIEGSGVAHKVSLPFADAASVENAIHCWVALFTLGIPPGAIASRLARLQPVAMRLELRRGIGDCTLIDDAYNSDLTSLRIALDVLDRQRQHPTHTVILSDMLQTGKPDAELYEEVASLIAGRGIKRFIGIGPALSAHRSLFKGQKGLRSRFFQSTAAFLKAHGSIHFQDEAILLKGARTFQFERIVAALEQEVHRTVLTINLSAMVDNLAAYRALLAPGTKVMAMVKAFSYGSGSFEIATALQHAGVDYLAVAYTDEGIALREQGISLPIMVMSPDVASFDRMITWRLEPEIFNHRSLAAFTAAAEGLGVFQYPIHVKLDTGMHRLGFVEADIPALISSLRGNSRVRPASIFSHLAASEDRSLDAFTNQQAELFERASASIIAELGTDPIRHLCNSAGIARHPEFHFDMVRLGLGLYGLDSSHVLKGKLKQISRLRTTIAQIKTVEAEEGVGYGNRGKSDHTRRIATVCIGYADGYPRALGHGTAHMLVRGKPAPTVGSVCMDLCMIDVTGITDAAEGDEVVVFGPELPLEKLASWSGTIPYETMTGISQRVKRVYVNEA
jgi:alanine racemase